MLHRPPIWSEIVFATTIQLFFILFFSDYLEPDGLLLWVWEEKAIIAAYTFPNLCVWENVFVDGSLGR